MVQPIRIFGHKDLRKHARKVKLGEDISKEIQDLIDTFKKVGGAGLAAPQIGLDLAVIVVGNSETYRVLINPEILGTEGPDIALPEGCLSVPVSELPIIVRPCYIEVQYYTEAFTRERHVYEAGMARVLFHEIDHLYGKLNFDLAPREWKRKYKRTLRDLEASSLAPFYTCMTADGRTHIPPPRDLEKPKPDHTPTKSVEDEESWAPFAV